MNKSTVQFVVLVSRMETTNNT